MDEKKQNNGVEVDLVEMLVFFLRRWYAFLIAVVAAAVLGLAFCRFFVTPQYRSTTKIYISTEMTIGGFQLSSQLVKDYEELICTRTVLEEVIEACNLNMSYGALKNKITVSNSTGTRIISITVEDPSPEKAQEIARAVQRIAAEHIQEVTTVETVTLADDANLPTSPSSPSYKRWGVISAAVGFLAVLAVLVIRFLLDDTVKTEEDVEKYLGLSVLAVVPLTEGKKQGNQKKK